ncbi:MAG TPA: DUF3263 domain-containing protein [Galbitalea sp.]|nr:DUF3263 domain-containing protein [Galbitalea sp.]
MSAEAARKRANQPELSERDIRILEFEREWWHHAGAKEAAIRSQFSLSAARYYQLLNAVIDLPGALRHDPMLVKRLLRARDARTQARSARAFTRSGHDGAPSHPTSEEPPN